MRMREPVREQGEMQFCILDDAIGSEHPARLLWRVVEGLELDGFVAGAEAVEGRQGRELISGGMMVTLWLYAAWEGCGGARESEGRRGCGGRREVGRRRVRRPARTMAARAAAVTGISGWAAPRLGSRLGPMNTSACVTRIRLP